MIAVAVALDRRRLELELLRSNARFAAIVAASPDQILTVGLDGRVRPEPGLDWGSADVGLPPDVVPKMVAAVRLALETGCAQRLEFERREKGGSARSYEARVSPMVPDEGLVVVRASPSRS